MKKLVLILLAVLLPFTACKKDKDDVDKLSFSIKNLTTLIKKSPKYIKQASPGVSDGTTYDGSLFYFFDDDAQLGVSGIGYEFEDDLCSFIAVVSPLETYAVLQYMMQLTEDELGTTTDYAVEYHSEGFSYEETFTTYDALWDYIEVNNVPKENVDLIVASHNYNEVQVVVLGTYVDDFFVTSISIMEQNIFKSTGSFAEKLREINNKL